MARHPLDLPSNVDTRKTVFERLFHVGDGVMAIGYLLAAGIAIAVAVGGLVYVGFVWEKAWMAQGHYLLAVLAGAFVAAIALAAWFRIPVAVYLVVGLATFFGYAVAQGYLDLFLP